jgi:hypothetical protein
VTADVQPLYYEAEAARRIGVTPRALRSERAAGRIGYRKVAGRVMYGPEDLAAWQDIVRHPPISEQPQPPNLENALRVMNMTGAQSAAAIAEVMQRQPPGFVYFIVSGERVKIGYSVNPKMRLKRLKTGAPQPLEIVATVPAYPHNERRLHKQFSDYRLHGEWFRHEGELRAFIARLDG